MTRPCSCKDCGKLIIDRYSNSIYCLECAIKRRDESIRRNNRKRDVCKTIYNHEKIMKDDPNSLTTEFMEEITGVSCERLKKEKEEMIKSIK